MIRLDLHLLFVKDANKERRVLVTLNALLNVLDEKHSLERQNPRKVGALSGSLRCNYWSRYSVYSTLLADRVNCFAFYRQYFLLVKQCIKQNKCF